MSPGHRNCLPSCAVLAVLTFLAWAPPVPAADEAVQKIYHRLLRSSLWVGAQRPNAGATAKRSWYTGTGSLLDVKNRLVITNYHVVGDEETVFVCFPTYVNGALVEDRKFYNNVLHKGGGGRGKVIARDIQRDLAIVQMEVIPPGVLPLALAAEGCQPKQRVHNIGNPGASDRLWECTSKSVVRIETMEFEPTNGQGEKFRFRAVMTDTENRPGESGGPLVNDSGELVGVTQGHRSDGRGIFVDLSEIKGFLERKGLLAKITAPPTPVRPPTETTKPPVEYAPEKPEEAGQAAERRLRFARLLLDGGKQERAREVLEEIISTFPSTLAAQEARKLLAKVK